MTYFKTICSMVIAILSNSLVYSQESKILDLKDADIIKFQSANLSMPIFRAYEYKDIKGIHRVFYNENQKTIDEQDTTNTAIQAIFFLKDHDHYRQEWKIFDTLEPSENIYESKEINIWFWTKYMSNLDIDKDGLIDPVIIYGTKTVDGFTRINIIIFYKDRKYAIRAHECDLDPCRTLKKSSNYKQLPDKIKLYLEKLLEKLRREQDVILHNG